ncbi:Activating signal cointegrator 1 complex subunit 3 [Nymphon striatum]|nr:Activating signal cointegrator 1 complex subunit 3 [Nymphon striatum]
MNLPRLSKSLRVYTDLTDREEENTPTENRYEKLHKKRKTRAAKIAKKEGITYDFLKEGIIQVTKNPCCQFNPEKVWNELLKVAQKFVGADASVDIVEGTICYLISLLKDSDMINQCQIRELKLSFGSFPVELPKEALDLIKKMKSLLPDRYFPARHENNIESSNTFGCDIKFHSPKAMENYSHIEFIENFSVEKRTKDIEISLKYIKKEEPKNLKKLKPPVESEIDWLEKELNKTQSQDSSMLVSEILDSIFILVSSSHKSSEELQTDLFDLLGFDRFTLIEQILQRRSNLSHFFSEQCDKKIINHNRVEQQPMYGCQVIVQSEEEKLLFKQMRKADKKNRVKKVVEAGEEEVNFDPVYLKQLREAALISAQNNSILGNQKSSEQYYPQEIRYPNVYDSQAKAKLSSAFISGNKMVLPDGFQRINNSTYEEITIPALESTSCANLGARELMPISELDMVGQIAFKGIKTLNKIQSTVFDTAYYSNENMLICAPTGAGKTNIAMLTVICCIKQHMNNDVIERDKFKIVYIAPMKALAAEMVVNFGKRLKPLGIIVKELTGDMQLTKQEIMQTQMLVTTPEKWDVVTRKSTGDVGLTQLVKLLILDEVHLLHGDRGPVLEALVARTIRQVETTQSMIRLVGLSATLPNYIDVASFLHVNPQVGLFYFDGRFRPVPLGQTFIGVKALQKFKQMQEMDEVCYEKCLKLVKEGHQVMVFVHARNATVRTAMILKEFANNRGHSFAFSAESSPLYGSALKQMGRSRNKQLQELFASGFAVHHAGMLRSDRSLVEKYFSDGLTKVLVCTATLAWGVNLPARAVIIKGTEIYDAKHGSFVDLGILDVMQIFGRAGRPQFDTTGHGTIITTHNKLGLYLSLLTNQYPIESSFNNNMTDNLNAEICLGTVGNIDEAVQWLSYTYLYIRMRKNPHVYGINYKDIEFDPEIFEHRRNLIITAAKALDRIQMIRFEENTAYLHATDLGRTASHFYIKYDTIDLFNEDLQSFMNEKEIFSMVSKSHEFEQLKVRDDELTELDDLTDMNCEIPISGGSENIYGKVNILLQTHVSRGRIENFSLVSDKNYVVQNMGRIARALFEIVLKKNWPVMAGRLLTISLVIDKQMWPYEHPLKQFDSILSSEIINKIQDRNLTLDKLQDMESAEIGDLIHHKKMGSLVKKCAHELPMLSVDANIQPITRSVLRIHLKINAKFSWNDRVHGTGAESFWIWVEDPDNNFIYHYENFVVNKKQVIKGEEMSLVFTIPVSEPLPSQYYVRVMSDRWLGSDSLFPISFKHLILPDRHPPHTELLDLDPLSISALNNVQYESLFSFSHFNPIQTQLFHTVYHTDCNVLLGAPTGSGKTIVAEIAMYREFNKKKGCKCVYIAPMKALVRERISDWKHRLQRKLNLNIVELTGDVSPDAKAIASADVIVTTPEKWDGISRSWQTRNYVQDVSLIIIDEIHLLGEDRGPVLEVIVSRTNFISSHTTRPIRIIGLSTAVANARDLADWLGIKQKGLYNFKPSVRPVPLQVHINGFPGKHYCPRMATMNKPTFQAIKTHSPNKPSLVFVSSRRQTRLTALDLIAFLALEDNPRQWVHISEQEIDDIIYVVKDNNLKLTLAFGIGMHHAGLQEEDRRIVEELFVNQKIQLLIATATLAWGVNFPAHLVVVKGTEYFDGKKGRYVDFPVTDVLQMMGRAGRPQYDDEGVAVILVQDLKKNFYKKFLYEPFPVESSLREVVADHMNAEIVSATITNKQQAIDYITYTYFFRRLLHNPSYYDLDSTENDNLNKFLSSFVDQTVDTLYKSSCVEIDEDTASFQPTVLGHIASFYYLSHKTVAMFKESLQIDSSIEKLLQVLTDAQEYDQIPVRHNEDNLNGELSKLCPIQVNQYLLDNSHVKTHLLLQAHFSHIQLPIHDYYTDLKSVLDQAIRILQAMIDTVADQGWLCTTIKAISLLQMIIQGCWHDDDPLLTLPYIEATNLHLFGNLTKLTAGGIHLPNLVNHANARNSYEDFAKVLRVDLHESQMEKVYKSLSDLPILNVSIGVKNCSDTEDNSKATEVHIRRPQGNKIENAQWIKVSPDTQYAINVSLKRLNHSSTNGKAVTTKFPKPKGEGWILVVGCVDTQELMALKKVGFVHQRMNSHSLVFYTPSISGRHIYTVYVFSDCYIGLDQQYDIHLDVQ